MPRRVDFDSQIDRLLESASVSQPPVPIERIADELNVQLQRSPLPDEMSGLLYREKDSKDVIIGVNSLHPPVRQRFTIAHEIGHFLLHSKQELYVDRDLTVRFRDERSGTAEDIHEIEANQFAAELLMPKRFLEADLKKRPVSLISEEFLGELARRYQVSTTALVFRLMRLGYPVSK